MCHIKWNIALVVIFIPEMLDYNFSLVVLGCVWHGGKQCPNKCFSIFPRLVGQNTRRTFSLRK